MYKRQVQGLVDNAGTPPTFTMNLGQFSSTVFFATEKTPRVDVTLPCGPFWELGVSKLLGVPIPSYAVASNDSDGADAPVPPGGCGEDANQDNVMVLMDLQSRCVYELWQARKEQGAWVASWGTAISMDSTGIYPNGMSARGSGFSFPGGLVWPDELAAGSIDHALVMSIALTKAGGPVPPATDSDGEVTDPAAIPEGARVRLDPTLDLSALQLTAVERTLAKAMQEYGIYVVDNGGSEGLGLYGVDPDSVEGNPYTTTLGDADFPVFPGIPVDRLQVLKLPPQDADYQSKLKPAENACARFQ